MLPAAHVPCNLLTQFVSQLPSACLLFVWLFARCADVAGLHCSCSSEGAAGFEVRVDGFSHKLGLLAGRVFDTLAGCKVNTP
jgi:hypothetical protein